LKTKTLETLTKFEERACRPSLVFILHLYEATVFAGIGVVLASFATDCGATALQPRADKLSVHQFTRYDAK
jgi:hypothetical protein